MRITPITQQKYVNIVMLVITKCSYVYMSPVSYTRVSDTPE